MAVSLLAVRVRGIPRLRRHPRPRLRILNIRQKHGRDDREPRPRHERHERPARALLERLAHERLRARRQRVDAMVGCDARGERAGQRGGVCGVERAGGEEGGEARGDFGVEYCAALCEADGSAKCARLYGGCCG